MEKLKLKLKLLIENRKKVKSKLKLLIENRKKVKSKLKLLIQKRKKVKSKLKLLIENRKKVKSKLKLLCHTQKKLKVKVAHPVFHIHQLKRSAVGRPGGGWVEGRRPTIDRSDGGVGHYDLAILTSPSPLQRQQWRRGCHDGHGGCEILFSPRTRRERGGQTSSSAIVAPVSYCSNAVAIETDAAGKISWRGGGIFGG